jgi:putative phosphoribosyl transferase
VFADRDDAGRQRAARLGHLRGEPVVVLGLPWGGVPVAFRVARALGAPLDVMVARRLGVPFRLDLLERAAVPQSAARAGTPQAGPADPPARREEVRPEAGAVRLAGYLAVPEGAPGIVVFAHGSGSGRRSPRNQRVAAILTEAGLGTLLVDLLTAEEEADRANVFDIGLLAARLAEVTGWLRAQPRAARAAVGYFGASTGAAAALWAAAEPGAGIAAVVSRGGRPDLARPRLAAVTAPTLLIVGGHDEVVLDLNRRAQAELRCENHLAVVPGASHLFEEPGTLDAAAGLARDWFISHLTR